MSLRRIRAPKMYHLLLTCFLIIITLILLTRRYSVEVAYWLLALLPTPTFLIGMADEYFEGIQQINHQLLHLAYDGSYALLLLGIILILRAILKRKLIISVVVGTCVAGLPIGYILITHH